MRITKTVIQKAEQEYCSLPFVEGDWKYSTPQLIDADELAAYLNLAKSTVRNRPKRIKGFPQPIDPSPMRWLRADIRDYLFNTRRND